MKIGVFGGTFDPPHIGHLVLASEAQEQLGLNLVLWVLTPFPPHKQDLKVTRLQDRMTMVLLAIAGNSEFSLSRVEIDRPPPHYAVDTVNILRQHNANDTFIYLMGADSLKDLLTWHEPLQFVSACHGIAVMKRHGESVNISELAMNIPGLSEKLYYLDTSIIEISGLDIRQRVKDRRPFRYLVPEKVHRYILNHKLYQS